MDQTTDELCKFNIDTIIFKHIGRFRVRWIVRDANEELQQLCALMVLQKYIGRKPLVNERRPVELSGKSITGTYLGETIDYIMLWSQIVR